MQSSLLPGKSRFVSCSQTSSFTLGLHCSVFDHFFKFHFPGLSSMCIQHGRHKGGIQWTIRPQRGARPQMGGIWGEDTISPSWNGMFFQHIDNYRNKNWFFPGYRCYLDKLGEKNTPQLSFKLQNHKHYLI